MCGVTTSEFNSALFWQVSFEILNTDDPPVAEDFEVTVYSGRPATINLPAYDPDGTPLEIFILKEPQGAGQVLKLTDEQTVGTSGRRKVKSESLVPAFRGELDPIPLLLRSCPCCIGEMSCY